MSTFPGSILYCLMVSFGVIIGTSVFAGIAALINNHPPLKTMLDIGCTTRIWAVAIALGGTFSSFEIIGDGLFRGEIKSIARQVILILFSLIGANLGCSFIRIFYRCGEIWMK